MAGREVIYACEQLIQQNSKHIITSMSTICLFVTLKNGIFTAVKQCAKGDVLSGIHTSRMVEHHWMMMKSQMTLSKHYCCVAIMNEGP